MSPPDRDSRGPAPLDDRLSKRFGDRVAFEAVSFDIESGEVFRGSYRGVIGVNVIHATLALAIGSAVGLVVLDGPGWRIRAGAVRARSARHGQ
jgi:hypothetical protein